MKNVLLIAPHFPPSNAPPVHRLRNYADHLREFGWNPIVLTIQPEYFEEELNDEIFRLFPPETEVFRSRAFPARWTRKVGIGDLGIRSVWFLWREARQICRKRKIDVLFITSPPWHPFLVGPCIKKEFRLPYVLDYTDPWVMSMGEHDPPWTKAYWFRKMALFLEPIAVRHADHVIAVSEGTNDGICRRYNRMPKELFTEIPIGASFSDFNYIQQRPFYNPFFDPSDGYINYVYIGAMLPKAYDTLRALFRAVSRIKVEKPALYHRLRFHFIGTTYEPNPKKLLVRPVADSMGLGEVVFEYPKRVSYLDAIQVLSQADKIFVLGTTETHYTPSKIFPCVLAKRPLLVLSHEKSNIVEILRNARSGEIVTYSSKEDLSFRVNEIYQVLLRMESEGYRMPDIDWRPIEKFSARKMTQRLVRVLEKVAGQTA
jgi:hypothetical protein